MGSIDVGERVQQPDIDYSPDWHKYQERVKRRLQSERLSQTLPPGFSHQLRSDLVWQGENLHETYDWTYVLNKDDLEELDAALRHFKSAFSSMSNKCS